MDMNEEPELPATSEDRHQRSVGLAIALGALVVLALMLAIAAGATHAFGP